jgi:uncharacterized protein
MEQLKILSVRKLQQLKFQFKRYLYHRINWNNRFIGIMGARGVGKTTLLLQRMKEINSPDAIYASLDNFYFTNHTLFDFVDEFYSTGGKYLFLDEVHKYPNWSQELKNIYDNFPELNIVLTSSSALEIYKGQYDLSRRLLTYDLQGLSFREFLILKHDIELPVITLQGILDGSLHLPDFINESFLPYKYLPEYLKTGYYPFFLEDEEGYNQRLRNAILLVIETDLPASNHIDYFAVVKLKKLLYSLSRIVPYTPNVSDLARQMGTTRDTMLKYLALLHKAHMLRWLSSDAHGINFLNKPDKLYLDNTNMAYALNLEGVSMDKGNMRETFVLNQLTVNNNVTYPKQGDFMVDSRWLLEVGGRSKNIKQIATFENSFVVSDEIEYPVGKKIPIWLLGLLY